MKKKIEFTVGGSVLWYFPISLSYLGFVKILWRRQIVHILSVFFLIGKDQE